MSGTGTLVEDAKNEGDVFVKKACIEPLEKAANRQIPNVTVSSESGVNQFSILPIQLHIYFSSGRIRIYALEADSTYIRSC